MMENTCGNCEKLVAIGNKRNAFASCKELEIVVPHQKMDEIITLWRIPESCPRDDVKKSSEVVKEKDWVERRVEDLLVSG
jgi:hypothetical protein